MRFEAVWDIVLNLIVRLNNVSPIMARPRECDVGLGPAPTSDIRDFCGGNNGNLVTGSLTNLRDGGQGLDEGSFKLLSALNWLFEALVQLLGL